MEHMINGKLAKHSSDLGVDELVEIAEGISYEKPKRIREAGAIIVFAVLTVIAFHGLYSNADGLKPSLALITCFAGILGADFVSGLVHWTLDSWGSIETPIVGRSLMIPFREHHIDPTAFTHRDFLVTWGDLCIPTSFFMMIPVLMLHCLTPEDIKSFYYFILFSAVIVLVASTNNQVHKWAHMHRGRPKLVKWLQKVHILLPIKHHHVHHQPPHMVKYCIITGWANYPLDFVDFWRKLEWMIETVTGMKPRQDDMKWSKKKKTFLKSGNELSHRLIQENISILNE